MIRLFNRHEVRKETELSGYWDFEPVSEEGKIPEKFNSRMFVPGCWENDIRYITYRGLAAYRKSINIKKKTNIRLEFKGVSHTANVYLDGEKIAYHYNAFTSFHTIVKNLEAGRHELVVLVDNRFSEASSLHIPNDYYTYGGLTRPVVISELSDVYIENLHFKPYMKDNKWYSDIKTTVINLSGEDKDISLRYSLEESILKAGKSSDITAIRKGERIVFEETMSYDDVKAWNTEEPNLYLLAAGLYADGADSPVDDLIERVGFREVEVQGRKLLLNGKEIFLNGFNRHEDHANAGCAITPELMAADIALIEDMNANTVRTCHYPNDERFLDICDERGLLVWEENHARGFGLDKMQNPNFERQCRDCIDEMIDQHFNHPSIIIWAVLNECASETDEGRRMYKSQIEQIRSLDSSRPVTFATCRHFTDICLDLVDIVSVNVYFGWYGDEMTKEEMEAGYLKELEWMESAGAKDKPIIISEFGAGAIYGCRAPTRIKWTEERQADILEATLSIYKNRPEIVGAIIWQFCDCRVTEEDWALTRPRGLNNKGIVDEYRRPKLAYNTVKEFFGSGK